MDSKDKWVAFDKQRKLTQGIKKKEREYYHQLFNIEGNKY